MAAHRCTGTKMSRITSGLHRVCGWCCVQQVCVWGSLAVKVVDSEANKEEKKPVGGLKYIHHTCMHVWWGAGIPLELQLTQTQKKHSSMAKTQNWDSCAGTTSLGFFFLSACAFLQNIGHWLAVRKESGILLFPHRATHPAVPAASARCTRLAHRAACLSPLDRFSIWRWWEKYIFTQSNLIFKIKTSRFAEHPVPTKPPAHTRAPT